MSAALELSAETAVVVAGQPVTAVTLFAPGGVETLLTKLEAEVRAIDRDISTPKGRAAVKSLAHKVARSKTALDEMGKGLNEQKRAEINKVDAERRVIRDRCDALKAEVLSELTSWEEQEAARIKAHEEALDDFAVSIEYLRTLNSTALGEWIERIRVVHRDCQWQEFSGRAEKMRGESIRAATEQRQVALEEETAAAERERLALEAEEVARQEQARLQRERDARIAAEAAEKARKEAEARASEAAARERQRVEQERQDAEERAREAERAAQAEIDALEEAARIASAQAEEQRLAAERQAREAEERATRAEQQRVEAERRAEEARIAAAEKAERDRIAAVEAERARAAAQKAEEDRAAEERARNMEIKRKVNFDAAAALVVHAGITEQQAQRVIVAIAKGQVPSTRISY